MLYDYCLIVNTSDELPYTLYKGLAHDVVYRVLDRPSFLNPYDGFDVGLFLQSFPDMGSFYMSIDGSILTSNHFNFPENTFIVNGFVFNGLDGFLNYINSTLATPISIPSAPSPVSSLNGNGCEFIDGIEVLVDGRETIYKITRSFYTIYADNAYIVCYDLQSTDGHKLTCPESLLTKYVAPTITP